MHHGPFPGSHQPVGQLERGMSNQAAELEQLLVDNHRLGSSLMVLRQDLVNAQHEIAGVRAHTLNIQKEGDIEVKGFLDSIGKMSVDLRAGEGVKEELLQAHKVAQSLVMENQELTAKIKEATEELKNFHADGKSIPEMHAELHNLKQERQKLHATFEMDKVQNQKEVQEMEERERDIVRLVEKLEKLRAEMGKGGNSANAPSSRNPNYGPLYPHSVHGVGPSETYRAPHQPRMN